MGTRGCFGFLNDGVLKITYNHFDSYPAYLGCQMCEAVASIADRVDEARSRVAEIVMVKADSTPTPEQIEACEGYLNLGVAGHTDQDWYCLLREAQGQPLVWIDEGLNCMSDGSSFVNDSLFCEWGYIINLDDQTLEIYIGFQREEHNRGRFAGPIVEGYAPIALLATLSFGEIPRSKKDINLFMGDFEKAYNESYDLECNGFESVEKFLAEWRETISA